MRTPCNRSYAGITCTKCKFGTYRDDLISNSCEECNHEGYFEKWSPDDKEVKSCESGECDKEKVHLSREINPHCLKSSTLAIHFLAQRRIIFFEIYLIGLIVHLIFHFLKKIKIEKNILKSEKTIDEMEQVHDRELLYVYLQGRNIHYDPWYLQLDLSREFKTFVTTSDYLSIIRVSFHHFKPVLGD